ncbi:MAG TPA: diguanylate cyclase [Planktothrix sp.]|jgi:hypothetical protein
MPLYDALSAGSAQTRQVHRLNKMSTIPTTEDLRYALDESRKKNKPVELPFENPHTRISFIVKVMAAKPPQVPSWTFLAGDGPQAQVLWTRATPEILMIQSKVKVECTRTEFGPSTPHWAQQQEEEAQPQEYYEEEPAPVAQPAFGGMSSHHLNALQNNAPSYGATPADQSVSGQHAGAANPASDPSNPFGGLAHAPSSFLAPPKPALAAPTADELEAQAEFKAMQSAAIEAELEASIAPHPTAQHQLPPGIAEATEFTPAPVLVTPPPAAPQVAPPAVPGEQALEMALPETDLVPVPNFQTAQSAPAVSPGWQAMSKPAGRTPLPEPFPLDWTIASDVEAQLCDPHSGLASINTFVFFLYRECKRFEKNRTPVAIISFEIRIQLPDNRIMPLPVDALPHIRTTLQGVLSPLDVMTHVSNGEFAVVLSSADRAAADEFCQRLHSTLTQTPILANVRQVHVAIGAAAIPETSTDPEVVIAAARQASEMAKQNRAPYFFFT